MCIATDAYQWVKQIAIIIRLFYFGDLTFVNLGLVCGYTQEPVNLGLVVANALLCNRVLHRTREGRDTIDAL